MKNKIANSQLVAEKMALYFLRQTGRAKFRKNQREVERLGSLILINKNGGFMKKQKGSVELKLVMLLLVCFFGVACSGVIATSDGIKSLGDMVNGAARTAKEEPTQPSEYFAHRATQEKASVGFWQRLTK